MPSFRLAIVRCVGICLVSAACLVPALAAEKPIEILFLGDNGHHTPLRRFQELAPVLVERGIHLRYTDRPSDLNATTLSKFDGCMVYANIDRIEPDQEKSLLDFVANGGGFIPLHCASNCFRNSSAVVALVGAQFQKHGSGVFRSQVTVSDHPVLSGYQGFESWDETYVHTQHNESERTVLEIRAEGATQEPWTWVRTHGKGRVFYTAWGHDERTWTHPGFQNLVERGVRWAVRRDPREAPSYIDAPKMKPRRNDLKPFEYEPGSVPFYPPPKIGGAPAEPVKKVQRPLAAEESQKHFVTPEGFSVELFAAEPDIGKPQAMTWDERGRLWLCETVDYPNELQPIGQGHDRIRICEDTNRDGRADKFTVFAEGLSIPQAITPFRGGVIVQNGKQTLYLKDTNGDDKADLRQQLISGWSQGDTHGGVSNFQYGHDNWIYAMQGYNSSTPVADGKEFQTFRQGFWRFRLSQSDPPRVSEIEFLRSTNNNSWGLGLSEEGLIFGSTANGNPSEYMPIPNRYYEQVRGWSSGALGGIAGSPRFAPIAENIRQVDHHGGFTAAAGHALYTARAWPPEYWNRTAFVAEPTGHLIAVFRLEPQGAGFRSRIGWNILASADEWCAPIMAEVGPDAQLWVIDWYNFIVQHNPTPAGYQTGRGNAYENNLRDKRHGRVYRVVYRAKNAASPAVGASPIEAAATPRSSLADVAPRELVSALESDNMFWRRQAQRLLIERGVTDVAPQLVALAKNREVDGAAQNPAVVHALWTMHGLGLLAGDKAQPQAVTAAIECLRHSSYGVRRNAALVLPRTEATLAAMQESGVFDDLHSQVKLAALLSLAEMPASLEAARILNSQLCSPDLAVSLVGNPSERRKVAASFNWRDPELRDGLIAAAARHDRFVLSLVLQQAAAEKEPLPLAPEALHVVRIVAEHHARGAPVETIADLLKDLQAAARTEVAAEVLSGLVKGWPAQKTTMLDDEAEQALAGLFAGIAPHHRASLVTLASRWGSVAMRRHGEKIAAEFMKTVRSPAASDAERSRAAEQLIEFQPDNAAAALQLLEFVNPRMSPELAQGVLTAVARSKAPAVGKSMASLLPNWTPSLRATALASLIARSEWTPALLDSLDNGATQLADLSLDQRQALSAHPNAEFAKRARATIARGGGLPDPDRQKVLDAFAPLAERTGDAAAGKQTFQKQCMKCHVHSGEGNKVGPELTGMAVHPKHELLVHLLDPSRNVEGNFRVYTVVLANGEVLTGLLASESKTAIELVNAEAKRRTVQRDEIERLVASSKSLMPDGFEKLVPPEEIINLLEFLTQRGKFVPVALDKWATVSSARGMFYDEANDGERLIFSHWKPREFAGVPFVLVDPDGGRTRNVIMLHGPNGSIPPKMPKSVRLPCEGPVRAIHFLSGVGGWNFPATPAGSVSLVVRLHFADGKSEDHELVNGKHFADYIRRIDVPNSKFAFALRSQQIRYFSISPGRPDPMKSIELVKGTDVSAPIVMAITLESP